MSVQSIRTKLKTKLDEMQSIKGTADWESSNPQGQYPFATLTLRDGEGEFRSTAHNLRRRGFRIRLYQEQIKGGQGPENAERISTAVIDEFEKCCDMDTTLSGTVKYVIPTSFVAEYQNREMDTRVLTINVDAYDLVSSS